MELQAVVENVRQEERENKQRSEQKRKEFEAAMLRGQALAEKELFPKLHPASVKNYLSWLRGYIENGGKPSHVYDYPFSRWKWYIAIKDIEPVALRGAESINIIIPAGIRAGVGDWGHCNLFYIDGYSASNFVPIFEDTNFPKE